MRRLAQPEVLKSAALAAFLTALVCYPRLAMWEGRPLPIWYVEANLFLVSIVLWAFVFAWHTTYTNRPVITLKIRRTDFAFATGGALAVATCMYFFVDPALRAQTPAEYPESVTEWAVKTLFAFAFLQLFLTFAPFAWLMRLFKHERVAIALTVIFGLVVLNLKSRSLPEPASLELFALMFFARAVLGFLLLWFYLRGGLLLAWWWGLLIHARHLFAIGSETAP